MGNVNLIVRNFLISPFRKKENIRVLEKIPEFLSLKNRYKNFLSTFFVPGKTSNLHVISQFFKTPFKIARFLNNFSLF